MKRKIIVLTLLAIAVVIAGYIIWGNGQNRIENEVLKIGVIMPQTGFLANPGQNVIRGIELYFNEFNKLHSANQVKLIIEDSKSDPKTGVSAINKLINVDNVKIIIGDLGSPTFLAMAPIAEQNKVVMISPGASNPKVRDAGDYIFRDYPSDEFDGIVMANYIFIDQKVNDCAISYFNNDYGIGLKDAFINKYHKLGGEIILNESFDENYLDFGNLIIKLKNSKSNNLYFIGSPKQSAYFLKQLKEQNLKINIFGNLAFEDKEFIDIAVSSFDKVIYSAPYFDAKSSYKHVVNFVQNFKLKYYQEPDLTSALGYDVANIIGLCLERTNFRTEKVKDEIYKVQNFDGLTGKTSFDEKGDVQKDVLIKQILGSGNIETLKTYSINGEN